jgi:hypothetical protein
MKTIRWVRVKWPLSLAEVSKRLLDNQYSEEIGRGFLLTSSGRERVAGKFVEKMTEKKITVDPFGNETVSYGTEYYVSKFSFDNVSSFIELQSPPRSIRKFASELHSIIGLGMELSDIQVDPLIWLNEIESLNSNLAVKKISSSAISVSRNGLAKISVSGKKDIRNEFFKLIGERVKVIDLVKFSGDFNQCIISAELTKSGSMKYGGHVYDGFLDDIRGCLERSISETG